MPFGDIVAVDLHLPHPMAAALGQLHTTPLRIGPRPILIATAPKGGCVGWRIRGVKECAIDGHEPIAPKEGTGHAAGLGDHLTALVHERLQTPTAQGLTASTES